MRFSEKNVALSRINSDDNTFQITTDTCVNSLADSIQKVGLIIPPILLKKSSKFIIVSGFRRIAACRQIGLQNVFSRVVDTQINKLECVKFAIIDNSFQRQLNLIEQSRSFYLLSLFFKDDIAIGKEASTLGLPVNPSFIKKIRKLYHFPQSIQHSIITNNISLDMALELERLEEGVGVDLADIFTDLKLSTNKQREIIFMLKEIALREDISILELFRESCFQEILNNDDLDRNQKTKKIRSCLKQRRYPALTKAEKEFKENVSNLKLGAFVKLNPPGNYDDSIYTLCLQFKNLIELKKRKVGLDKIIKNPSMDKILR